MDDTAPTLTAAKRAAGYLAADMVKDGMVLGLGTGSTVFFALERLSCRVCEGLKISGVPTSHQTAVRAREYGIPLTTLDDEPLLDLAIDGADQVDGQPSPHKRQGCCTHQGEMRCSSCAPLCGCCR